MHSCILVTRYVKLIQLLNDILKWLHENKNYRGVIESNYVCLLDATMPHNYKLTTDLNSDILTLIEKGFYT